jgi:hypothetical protein
MNIRRNDKIIKRNARIGQIAMLGGLAVLAGGMFISFRYPEQFNLSLVALLLGFMLSQLGIFYSNRWGRRPRADELIDQALKGLDKKFSLFHYTSPVRHLLVGPSGLWVLLPFYQRGTITYAKNRWQQRGANLYLKIFAQEGLGRPEIEVASEVEKLQSFLKKHMDEENLPAIQAALVFTNPKTVIDIPADAAPPAETVTLKELKELVRKTGKGKALSLEKIQSIVDTLTTT